MNPGLILSNLLLQLPDMSKTIQIFQGMFWVVEDRLLYCQNTPRILTKLRLSGCAILVFEHRVHVANWSERQCHTRSKICREYSYSNIGNSRIQKADHMHSLLHVCLLLQFYLPFHKLIYLIGAIRRTTASIIVGGNLADSRRKHMTIQLLLTDLPNKYGVKTNMETDLELNSRVTSFLVIEQNWLC